MNIRRTKIPLFLIAGILFGLKTYIVYRFIFNIEIENSLQEIIIFLNPFVSSIVFFALSIWLNKLEHQMKFIRFSALFGTLIIYFNLVFYRSFTDFLTIPQLFQTSNILDLSSSILSLIKIYDVSLFIDVIIIWYLMKKQSVFISINLSRRRKTFILTTSMLLLTFNFLLAEVERPQLFTRGFDREYLVKNIGLFYYHVYDIVMHSKVKSQRVLADGNDLNSIEKYINDEVKGGETLELFGLAKDRNVIFISAESLQSFVINNELNGAEITPFLNRLVTDEDTYYFENFYHQTAQGKTSDSEFLTENSLYPSSRGAVFFTHGQNKYHALPEIIKEYGYESAVFHANNESFWNRTEMYHSLTFDHFYDKKYYDVNDENSVGWGLKDKPFFSQSIPYLESLPQPFYSKFITLTNHFPFELAEDDRSIEHFDSNSNTLNNYFPTVRYMDEAIEQFFNELKLSGLYENSIIIIMGDHDGISANHNKALSMYLDKDEITPYDYAKLQRVPLFIHIPGHGEGKVMSTISGQIDLKPTMLHLLGIQSQYDLYFGNSLFQKDRKEFIAFRNGDFISEQFLLSNGICYDQQSGVVLTVETDDDGKANETPCDPLKRKVEMELNYSDEIIYGDLLRFVDFNKK